MKDIWAPNNEIAWLRFTVNDNLLIGRFAITPELDIEIFEYINLPMADNIRLAVQGEIDER